MLKEYTSSAIKSIRLLRALLLKIKERLRERRIACADRRCASSRQVRASGAALFVCRAERLHLLYQTLCLGNVSIFYQQLRKSRSQLKVCWDRRYALTKRVALRRRVLAAIIIRKRLVRLRIQRVCGYGLTQQLLHRLRIAVGKLRPGKCGKKLRA